MGEMFGGVATVATGPPVVAEAPPASRDNPAAPNTGTVFFAAFRFDACFARGIVNSLHALSHLSFSLSFVRSEKAPGKAVSLICQIINFLSHRSCPGVAAL